LALYRRAVALCAPEDTGLVGSIYANIGQLEMLLQHPIASLAAWEIAQRCLPQEDSIRERQAAIQKGLPDFIRRERRFVPSQSPDAGSAWEQALAGARSGRLSDAEEAFARLTGERPDDAAAWHNLGLVRAWLGENESAIDALEQYVELESDEDRAAEAWSLAELLRLGEGMTARCDHFEYTAVYPVQNPEVFARAIQNDRRIADPYQDHGVIGAMVLDREMPAIRPDLASFELPILVGHILILGDQEVRLIHGSEELFVKGQRILEEITGPSLGVPQVHSRACPLNSLVAYWLPIRLPQGLPDEQASRFFKAACESVFEEEWPRRPLKSLNNICPLDAAGHVNLRKKLRGLVTFLDEIVPYPYDFDRLRHKLGLPTKGPLAAASADDIAAMNAEELSRLELALLSDEQLMQAFSSARRLDAGDLAEHFALKLVDHAGGPADRFGVYAFLADAAAGDGDFAEAHGWLDAGLKHDCEQNEGRLRNALELRRARLYVQAKDSAKAADAFAELVERTPGDLDLLSTACESMLRVGQRERAAGFAEQGLARARQTDRGRVREFEELLASALGRRPSATG
jgi:tetratricopeptide (TPR) repeat protein